MMCALVMGQECCTQTCCTYVAVEVGPTTGKIKFTLCLLLEAHLKDVVKPRFCVYVGCDLLVILDSGTGLSLMQRHSNLSTEM